MFTAGTRMLDSQPQLPEWVLVFSSSKCGWYITWAITCCWQNILQWMWDTLVQHGNHFGFPLIWLWKWFCVCCDGCLGIRLGPLSFCAGDDNAVTTVDTFCYRHQSSHAARTLWGMNLSTWSSGPGQSRSTAGKGRLSPPFWFSFCTILFLLIGFRPIRAVWSRLTKSTSFMEKCISWLDSSWYRGDTVSNSVALIWRSDV